MLDSCKPMDVLNAGTVNVRRYRDEDLESCVPGCCRADHHFYRKNAKPHRAHILVDFLKRRIFAV